jgi:hypothetical protein
MSKIDDEILSGLTDEERAALDEPDGAGNLTLADSLAGKGPQDDDTTTNDEPENVDTNPDADASTETAGDDDTDAAAETAGKPDAAAAADAAAAGDDTRQAADDAQPVDDAPAPLLVAEMPENADARMKEIGDKKGNLLEQHENGDITTREYQQQLDALNKEERELERAIDKARTAQELHQQQQINNWMGQVKDFTTKAHPEYAKSKVRYMALDTFVREVGSDPANANLTAKQILEKAHAKVQEDLGVVPGTAAGKTNTTGKTAADKTAELNAAGRPLKGSKAEAPKTLRDVPATAANDTGENGRWAALDRLQETDPEAHENKLMRMSADERDAYLASRP